jgi:hypothetical protein
MRPIGGPGQDSTHRGLAKSPGTSQVLRWQEHMSVCCPASMCHPTCVTPGGEAAVRARGHWGHTCWCCWCRCCPGFLSSVPPGCSGPGSWGGGTEAWRSSRELNERLSVVLVQTVKHSQAPEMEVHWEREKKVQDRLLILWESSYSSSATSEFKSDFTLIKRWISGDANSVQFQNRQSFTSFLNFNNYQVWALGSIYSTFAKWNSSNFKSATVLS